jgi:hypothetical protein
LEKSAVRLDKVGEIVYMKLYASSGSVQSGKKPVLLWQFLSRRSRFDDGESVGKEASGEKGTEKFWRLPEFGRLKG